MGDVAKLRQPGEPISVAVATGIVVGLTNNRQITFQTGHEGNEDPDTVFARYMGVMKIADRIQAVYEIGQLPVPDSLRDNVEFHFYESGHMVYLHEPSMKALHDNVADFIRRTSAAH